MPVYCITGTNRGLGLEFVRQLAQSGDNTIIAATRSLSSDLTDLKAVASPSTHILECDTGDVPSIHAFVKAVARTLGEGKKIDYLLNVAGVNLGSSQNSLNLGPDELHAQLSINVIGPAKTVELLLDGGLLSPDVRILNMTSGLASLGLSSQSARKCTGYAISKAALNMLTVHQSADLKAQLPGAVIIAMDPGWVKTRMGGAGAQLEPSKSIGDMLVVLHGLRAEDTASFYCYSGDKVPW